MSRVTQFFQAMASIAELATIGLGRIMVLVILLLTGCFIIKWLLYALLYV